jgi:hypothetical protein
MRDASFQFDLDALDGRVADDPGAPEFPALAEALRRSGFPDRARDVALAGLESAPSRLAGRVALALAQMDLGAPGLGRRELECVLDEMLEPYRLEVEPEAALTPVDPESEPNASEISPAESAGRTPALASLGEHEIDAAFDEAESRAEEMYSPNTMAERVLDAEAPVIAHLADEVDDEFETGEAGDGDDDFDFASSQTFTTRTMAGLLERQGDRGRAESIRSVIDGTGGEKAHESVSQMDAAEAPETVSERAPHKANAAERARVLATLERWLHNLGRGVA